MNLADAFGLQVLRSAERQTSGWKMLIGGEWVEAASGRRMATVSPACDEAIAEVPAARPEDVQRAVDAATAAFPAWSRIDVAER